MPKSQKATTVVVSVRMPRPLRSQIETLAEQDQRSVSAMIVRVIRAGLNSLPQAPAVSGRRSADSASGIRRGQSARSPSSSARANEN